MIGEWSLPNPRFDVQYLRHQQAMFYMGNSSSEVEVDELDEEDFSEYDREEEASSLG